MMRAWIRVVAVVSLALNLALGWALVRRHAAGAPIGEWAAARPSGIPVAARLDEPANRRPDPVVERALLGDEVFGVYARRADWLKAPGESGAEP